MPRRYAHERAEVGTGLREQLETLVRQMIERGIRLDEGMEVFERKFIDRVLAEQRGNQCNAARRLGIHRNTLSRKITQYKLRANGSRD